MKCYAVAELDIVSSDWIPEYVAQVTPLVEARRAGSTGELVLVAGEDVNRVANVP
jgi:uncharacterized protein (DUF1330 family)